jgi:hypothetical protein
MTKYTIKYRINCLPEGVFLQVILWADSEAKATEGLKKFAETDEYYFI